MSRESPPKFIAETDAALAAAVAHFGAGHLPAAAAIGRDLLGLQPKLAEALHLMGAIALRRERFEEAIGLIGQAIALDGTVASFHNSLGQAHRGRGAADLALASYERAISLNPGFGLAHANIAQLFLSSDPAAAVAYHRRLAAALPRNPIARSNLAYMIERTGDLAEAETVYRESLALEPNQVVAQVNLGVVLADLGRIDEAMALYRMALTLDPTYVDAHNALGLALLLRGAYAEAWPYHESRPRDWVGQFRVPRWKGEPLDGQRILLHAEQGMGDTLQFLRYVPLVAARGGRIVLAVSPAIERLVEGMAGVEQIVTGNAPPGGLDWHCPLMSLPLAFGTVRETIPGPWPYLAAPADRLAPWRKRIGRGGTLKVGLVWKGQPKLRRDRDRSMPAAALAPLAGIKGVRYFSLQKAVEGNARGDLPAALKAIDLADGFEDFAETAAALMALDLIVTVDTAVAHLAGALDRPVWLMVSHVPDWRWGEAGSTSPWYPSVRLIRQSRAGAWDDVVAQVAQALRELVG